MCASRLRAHNVGQARCTAPPPRDSSASTPKRSDRCTTADTIAESQNHHQAQCAGREGLGLPACVPGASSRWVVCAWARCHPYSMATAPAALTPLRRGTRDCACAIYSLGRGVETIAAFFQRSALSAQAFSSLYDDGCFYVLYSPVCHKEECVSACWTVPRQPRW